MNSDDKVTFFTNFLAKKEIDREVNNKKIRFELCSVDNYRINEYIEEGWEIDKEFKTKTRLKKPKKIDIAFEDEVWSLFALMGSKLLNKDRKFVLDYGSEEKKGNTKQLDVVAIDDETILVIECKTTEVYKNGDFKKELESYKSMLSAIEEKLRFMFDDNGKKRVFKFVLATKNLGLNEKDKERLKEIDGFHLNDDMIEYFFKLYEEIGEASRYQFMASIFDSVTIPNLSNEVPAIRGKMGEHTYYSFIIEPEKLLKLGYVLHKSKGSDSTLESYQRLIKKNRLKSVREFVNSGGYFPNSVILNIIGDNCEFKAIKSEVNSINYEVGVLHLPQKYKSLYVIDGQHRLYGYSNCHNQDVSIPVVAFQDLSGEEQIKIFMDINENQKQVSKDLRITLKSDMLWNSDDFNEKCSAIMAKLSISLGQKDSPLYPKVSVGEDSKTISLEAIVKALKKTLFFGKVSKKSIVERGLFFDGDNTKCFRSLKAFLFESLAFFKENLNDVWNEESKGNFLICNKGMYGLILIISDVLNHLTHLNEVDSYKTPNKILVEKCKKYFLSVIRFINEVDLETKIKMQKTYGAGGDTIYWRNFQKAIYEEFPEFNPEGLSEYFEKESKVNNGVAFTKLDKLLAFFNQDFEDRLIAKYGQNWYKQKFFSTEWDEATLEANKRNREIENTNDEVTAWSCINSKVYKTIANKLWKGLFENDYAFVLDDSKSGKPTKADQIEWMSKFEILCKVNRESYYATSEDLSFIERIYDWKINRNIN